MNKEIVNMLKKKQQKITKEIEHLERQLIVLNEMIHNETTEKNFTRKSSDKTFYKNTIKRILKINPAQTYKLYQLICVDKNASNSTKLNYSTFRSYLSQMKKNKELCQDNKRYWHIKIDAPEG